MYKKIHVYKSTEPMLSVNAFIVEGENKLVIVDTTLTMSDSIALRKMAEELKKPIAAILLTHGHPDHVAGSTNINIEGSIPIYAVESIKTLMEKTEAEKHAQWSRMFGEEWIPKWNYPTHIVKHNEVISIDEMTFKVYEIGSGGDCDANSFWLLEGENPVAFLGDFIYKNNHSYMADGSILRWLTNIELLRPLLKKYNTFYIGHGEICTDLDIEKQKQYILDYCSTLLSLAQNAEKVSDQMKQALETQMIEKYPNYGCQFMITLAADKVFNEIKSK